jgi:ATP-dependent RNA helicase MSS116
MTHLTTSTFASLAISAPSKRALLEVLRFQYMTTVQNATLPVVLEGQDVLAKAKTGTGKTIAFLLPAVEALHRTPPRGAAISVLVLSPTRELASQIAKEAELLLTFHPFKSQVIYGGTNINSERNRMNNQRCDVLVATPGRLIDHLENTQGLSQRLQGIQALILDEADQLLEMGFRPAIERILGYLPKQRQTLLFSATMPQSVHQVAGLALRPRYAFVDTVPKEDAATNVQVHQSWVAVPFDQTLLAVRCILRSATAVPGHKVIVFFTTARLTQYMAALMEAAGLPVLEIHSRKSQSAREKASAAFRAAPQAVLLTSDVSARGVDYPDVTLVLQVGQPSSREQYIHRLGRTARAGKAGQGVLLLAPFESQFVRELRGERSPAGARGAACNGPAHCGSPH